MVASASRFTILATVASLAVLSLPADAAVIPGPRSSVIRRATHQREQVPVVPLPAAAIEHKNFGDDRKKAGGWRFKSKKGKSRHESGLQRYLDNESPAQADSRSQTFFALPHPKRSLLIPGPDSTSYIVQHTRRAGEEAAAVSIAGRESDPEDGVPGSIDIVSAVADSPIGKRIASLSLERNTGNLTSAEFVLNASSNNVTQFQMVTALNPTSGSSNTNASGVTQDAHVKLQINVYDPAQLNLVRYCATFNPCPPQPEPLSVEPCFVNSEQHKSQVFSYNRATGVIRPMWFDGEDDSMSDTQSTDPETPDAKNAASITDVDSTTNEGTTDSMDSAKSGAIEARDVQAQPSASPQNVKLVFTPSTPSIPVEQQEEVAEESASVITQTVTTTATTTQTTVQTIGVQEVSTSELASKAIAPSSDTTASGGAPVTAAGIESASATTSPLPASPTTSTTAPATTSTSSAELKVQVVGPDTAISSTDSTALTSTSTATDTIMMTPSSVATTTSSVLNAEAIGSSIMASESSANLPSSETGASTVVVAVGSSPDTGVDTVATATGTSSASEPSLTPVNTAPYEWMFVPQNPRL